mgnify:CR=1 FL=1
MLSHDYVESHSLLKFPTSLSVVTCFNAALTALMNFHNLIRQ